MMYKPTAFIRFFVVLLAVFIGAAHQMTLATGPVAASKGAACGLLLGMAILGFDAFIRRLELRTINITILGLFFGYLLGQGLLLSISQVIDLNATLLSAETIGLIKGAIFLLTTYIAMMATARAAEEIHLNIPFLKLQPTALKKRDLLIDLSALSDPRLIDLAASGLVDNYLVLPRCILSDLYKMIESTEERERNRGRRMLDVIKKLEMLPELHLRQIGTDCPESSQIATKLLQLARMHNANILSADLGSIEQMEAEEVRIINIHTLSNALKPLAQAGEQLQIKVQRPGKEPGQGVGYLEDRTMVVINGGADFIGETITTQVLSVKHTSSGRIIFCNASDRSELPKHHAPEHYFALQCDSGSR